MRQIYLIFFLFTTCTFSNAQIFNEVKIGEQIWMTDNLNVDKFRNGDPIPHAKSEVEWKFAGENQRPAWCYYENNSSNGKKYGKLYNWYAVNDIRGLAPLGYHISSQEEWIALVSYLGVEAGKKMKTIFGWSNEGNGNNESGFSALPGSCRKPNGFFVLNELGYKGYWWFSSGFDSKLANGSNLYYLNSSLTFSVDNKQYGFSVRCVKD